MKSEFVYINLNKSKPSGKIVGREYFTKRKGTFFLSCAVLFVGLLILINSKAEAKNEKLISPIPAVSAGESRTTPTVYIQPESKYHKVSWYGQEYCDKYSPRCITASGERFVESDLTFACGRDMVLGTRVRFTYKGNSVVARCNDRGSFQKKYGRVADLSKGTFSKLASLSKGVISVEMEVID